MNLFVPEIGSKLKLTSDWTFILYSEYRNEKMFAAIGKKFSWGGKENYIVTIPKDTILGVDRIYIRKGVSAYSSITFTIPKVLNKKNPFAGTRFWVKLSDVNKIEFDFISCNEQTLDLIKTIDEKTKILLESIDQSIFMKILLNGATVNNVRPQEFPEHFILKLNPTIETFKLKNKTKEYTNLEMEMKKLIRKYKIASLPFENDTND
jgi:hypothetical protein